MSSANSDRFTSSFPIWIPFVSSIFLIGVTKASNTMLNESGKTGILVLFLILGKKDFSFSVLSMMLTMGL